MSHRNKSAACFIYHIHVGHIIPVANINSSLSRWPSGLQPLACWDCRFESRCSMNICLLWVLVLSGRGLCDRPITRPEKSYRLWCVCDRKASIMRRPWPTGGCWPWKERSNSHSNVFGIATKLQAGRSAARIPVGKRYFYRGHSVGFEEYY
jgi:hypothetical protein